MQVLPVFYTQRWTAVTISLVLGLGPGLAMCKLIRTHFIQLWSNSFQQQGYQHARLFNLCLVIYNLWRFDTAERTYNCSPIVSIPFCEMAMAVVMELIVSKVLHAVQYWVTKAVQSIHWGAFGMALLRQIAVSFSPTSQFTSAREGRARSTEHTTSVQPHWILWPNLRTLFSHVICCCPQHPFN